MKPISASVALAVTATLSALIDAAPAAPHPGACIGTVPCPVRIDSATPTPIDKFTTIIPAGVAQPVPLMTVYPDAAAVMSRYAHWYADEHSLQLTASTVGAVPLLEFAVSYIAEKSLWSQIGAPAVVLPAPAAPATALMHPGPRTRLPAATTASGSRPSPAAPAPDAGHVQPTIPPSTSVSLWRPSGHISTATFLDYLWSDERVG